MKMKYIRITILACFFYGHPKLASVLRYTEILKSLHQKWKNKGFFKTNVNIKESVSSKDTNKSQIYNSKF